MDKIHTSKYYYCHVENTQQKKKKQKNIRTLITKDYSDNRFDFRSFKYIKYFIKTLQNICCLQTTFKQLKTGEKQLGTYLCNFDIN